MGNQRKSETRVSARIPRIHNHFCYFEIIFTLLKCAYISDIPVRVTVPRRCMHEVDAMRSSWPNGMRERSPYTKLAPCKARLDWPLRSPVDVPSH